MQDLIDVIESGFADPSGADARRLRDAVQEVIAALDAGSLRVAEKSGRGWRVNEWVKKAVLLSFRFGENAVIQAGHARFFDKVPLKYAGLSPLEIWISEAQERMVFAVPPENADRILAIFAGEDSEAVFVGEFTDDRMLTLRYEGEEVARGQTVGRTGVTGLAGGDHLHFTMLVGGVPVDAREWWDPRWIETRVAGRLGAGFPFSR